MALVHKPKPSCGTLALVLLAAAIVLSSDRALAQERMSLSTRDRLLIYADLYGTGPRGVVLAHGGQFTNQGDRLTRDILRFLSTP
jgi:hypothetical protein